MWPVTGIDGVGVRQCCDAAIEHCGRLGGQTVVPAMDQAPGRMVVLADDQDAHFWVIALNPDFSMAPV